MKHVLTTLSLFLVLGMHAAFSPVETGDNNNQIQWQSWNTGYPEALENQKILLVDVYTDWCGWCKKMDKDTYTDADIKQLIEESFVPVKFNPEEKKTYQVNGKEVSSRELLAMLVNNQRIGYPTTIFLYPEKRKIQLVQGYQGPNQFEKTLRKIREQQ